MLLPVLRDQRRVLFFLLLGDLRCIGSASAVGRAACVGPGALTLKVLLELDGALRVVEHLGEEVPLSLLDSLRLLELIHGLLTLLVGSCLLGSLLRLGDVQSLVRLLVGLLEGHAVEPSVDVSAQVVVLDAFPLIPKLLHRVESAAYLLWGELTVLPHRVDADHILDLGRGEGLWLDLGPVALVSHVLGLRVIGQ